MSTIKTLLAITALTIAAQAAPAGDCCPDCGVKVCKATWEKTKEKKHCYEIECKDICIPKYRLPWQMCCDPECGRVRTISVMKKVDYECESCGCQWEVVCVGNDCCGGCEGGCADSVAGRTDRVKNTEWPENSSANFSPPALTMSLRTNSPADAEKNAQEATRSRIKPAARAASSRRAERDEVTERQASVKTKRGFLFSEHIARLFDKN